MTRRKSQEIPSVECIVLDKGANLRVDQGPERFEGVKYEAMAVGFVLMQEADGQTCAEAARKEPRRLASFA